MGWCIKCHRETDVKMEGNAYYTKIHDELSKKYGATTPEAIAASLLWLVSDASAAELTQKPNLIDLQALIKTKALAY